MMRNRILRDILPRRAKIKIRKSKNDGSCPMYENKELDRLLFGLGEKQKSNHEYTMNLVKTLLGPAEYTIPRPFGEGGFVKKIVSCDEEYPFQFIRSFYGIDENGEPEDDDNYPFTFYAVVHANDIRSFVKRSKRFNYDGDQGGYDDLLDSPETEVYVHSITCVTSKLFELARRNARVHLILNEKIADYLAFRIWY